MDRTSILGDAIDYMKELLGKIKGLQEEVDEGAVDRANILGLFRELGPGEVPARGSPKFDVERGDGGARIEVCCAGRPGLLLSTLGALEGLGLDVRQCAVSCFGDFGMRASCSENEELRAAVGAEDIKQALLRCAGYGGRCL